MEMAFAYNGQPSATRAKQTQPPLASPHENMPHCAPFHHVSLEDQQVPVVQMEEFRNFNPQTYHHLLAGRPHQTTLRSKPEKRSLNSFMAFRSFYKPMFPKLQQKEASTFLTTMWKSEPFKAKWAIIAKAYSIIRDAVGKNRASLVVYLTLVCPEIGIIDAEDYFEKMNWSFEIDADGTTVLKQTSFPDLSCFEKSILYTNMTPRDIIQFCTQMAYIPQHIAIRLTGGEISNAIGVLQMSQTPQQSLLASYPILPKVDQCPSVVEAGVARSSPDCPQFAGTSYGAIPKSCDTRDGGYQWTGSMSELYNPAKGSIDLDSMIRDQEGSLWGMANICIPQSFDFLVPNSEICDGYIHPLVPSHETLNGFGTFHDKS